MSRIFQAFDFNTDRRVLRRALAAVPYALPAAALLTTPAEASMIQLLSPLSNGLIIASADAGRNFAAGMLGEKVRQSGYYGRTFFSSALTLLSGASLVNNVAPLAPGLALTAGAATMIVTAAVTVGVSRGSSLRKGDRLLSAERFAAAQAGEPVRSLEESVARFEQSLTALPHPDAPDLAAMRARVEAGRAERVADQAPPATGIPGEPVPDLGDGMTLPSLGTGSVLPTQPRVSHENETAGPSAP